MPNKFQPIQSSQEVKTALQAANHNFMMLDAEVNTKTYGNGKTNQMSFLIPLCLTSDSVVDIALVVSKTATGKYEGSTILTLDWAYTDARLVGRPGMDWLSANHISGGNSPLI